MRGHLRRWLGGVLVALAVAGCGLQQDLSQRTDLEASQLKAAPPLVARTLAGNRFDLAAQRGHPVVLDFWASWCGPCRKQQPQLDELSRRYAPRRVTFMGVDLRDDTASARAYIDDFQVPYSSIEDPSGDISGKFDVPAPPVTLVIDAQGQIVLRRLGGITVADLAPTLDRLLRAAVSLRMTGGGGDAGPTLGGRATATGSATLQNEPGWVSVAKE